jgi:NAD+ kinase
MTRALVFVKRTGFDSFSKTQRVATLLAHKDPRALRLQKSHELHYETVAEVERALAELGVSYAFDDAQYRGAIQDVDLVISVGGDGTLLLASHRIGRGVPILGLNSAPHSSVGFFCAGKKGTAKRTIASALARKLPATELHRMCVEKNDRVLSTRVLNDALFCHESPAATSRYRLSIHHANAHTTTESQRSSGIWVGPAAGSTAAQRSAGGRVLSWSSRSLQYVVREPYTPRSKRLALRRGLVRDGERLVIETEMHEAILFLDGPRVRVPVSYGDVIAMKRSHEPLTVLGFNRALQTPA